MVRILIAFAFAGILYLVLAYLVLPAAWTHYEREPALAGRAFVTRTAQGIPGDPLNVGLAGSEEDVLRAMHAAGWFAADPVTLRSSAKIAGSVLFDRPYRGAPVSALYYDGRKEDLAYEKPAGTSAQRRHHVRFWRVLEKGADGRPLWLGAATFDRGVGLSHYTGAVTHHIAPDIDTERDGLTGDLVRAGMVEAIYQVTGLGPALNGRNGEGDFYVTDGEIHIARLVAEGRKTAAPPRTIAAPVSVRMKDAIFVAARTLVPDE